MTIKTLRLLAIITVIFALILGVLALFNQSEVICSLYGYQWKTSLAMIVFCSFLVGVLYAGTIGIILFIKAGSGQKQLKNADYKMKEPDEE